MDRHKKNLNLKKFGVFNLLEAQQAGYSQPTIFRLVERGEIIRLDRGIFRHKDARIKFENLDFIVATKRFGTGAIVGLYSALSYYGLIEQVPEQVWLLVPPSIRSSNSLYRCIRVKTSLKIGIDDHKDFAITNIERTIVESFKYSTKIGLDIAVHASRLAIDRKKTTLAKIFKLAKLLKMERSILRHWEAIAVE